jgi:hypothetical protein
MKATLENNHRMNKAINFVLDIALLVLFLILGSTGLIIFPGLLRLFGGSMGTLPKFYLYEIHHWIGLVLLVLISLHLDLHWKWIKSMTKRLRKNTKKTKTKKPLLNYSIDIGLIITFTVMFITGIIKFRGFTAWTRLDPQVLPMYEISLLHDHVGLLALLFSILHILLHLRWIATTAKTMAQRVKPRLVTYWKKLISVFMIICLLLF